MKRDTLSNRRGFTQQTTYEVAKQFHWLSVHRTLTVSLGRIQDLKNRPPENYCVPRSCLRISTWRYMRAICWTKMRASLANRRG